MMRRRFEGKNVFVTGAGSGFGRATALRFAEEGAVNLYLVDLRPGGIEAVKSEIEALGAKAHTIVADVGDPAACEEALATALAVDPRLDVLVSNAAPFHGAEPFLELKDETWYLDVAVNLNASFVLGQRAARSMAQTGGGSILYTASISAGGAGAGHASYCATKAGIIALAKVMAVELAPFKIRVNTVSPGPADTARSVQLVGEELMDKWRVGGFPVVPLNRLASADDIAYAFLFLASDEAAYISGIDLTVDGALTAQTYNVPPE